MARRAKSSETFKTELQWYKEGRIIKDDEEGEEVWTGRQHAIMYDIAQTEENPEEAKRLLSEHRKEARIEGTAARLERQRKRERQKEAEENFKIFSEAPFSMDGAEFKLMSIESRNLFHQNFKTSFQWVSLDWVPDDDAVWIFIDGAENASGEMYYTQNVHFDPKRAKELRDLYVPDHSYPSSYDGRPWW